ncbi:uncharacterized, partial [Tachysurus ichikawai]
PCLRIVSHLTVNRTMMTISGFSSVQKFKGYMESSNEGFGPLLCTQFFCTASGDTMIFDCSWSSPEVVHTLRQPAGMMVSV